jgi:NitT/TauT family transport system substrate-binding protein
MKRSRRIRAEGIGVARSFLALSFVALLVAGCGGDDPVAQGKAEKTKSLSPATLRLPWVIDETYAHYFLADKAGYYANEGWDVDILPGRGSNSTVQLVGQGRDTFGIASMDTVVRYASDGGNLIAVGAEEREYVGGLLYRSDHIQIDSLDDLVGKTVITSPASSYTDSLLNLLKSSGIDQKDIKWQYVDHVSGKISLFRSNPEAVAVGGLDSELVEYQKVFGDKLIGASFKEFGFTMYGQTIITQASYFREKPEEVCRFVRATLKGLSETIADPQPALDALTGAEPDLAARLKEPGAKEGLVTKLALSGDTDALPIGKFEDQAMESIVTYLAKVDDFDALPTSDYYTNDCIDG